MDNEELAKKIDKFNSTINSVQKDYAEMRADFSSMRSVLVQVVGDPNTPALKGAIERVFDRFKNLPCSTNESRIYNLEKHGFIRNGAQKERKKWVDLLIKIAPYLLATAGSGGIVGVICRFL